MITRKTTLLVCTATSKIRTVQSCCYSSTTLLKDKLRRFSAQQGSCAANVSSRHLHAKSEGSGYASPGSRDAAPPGGANHLMSCWGIAGSGRGVELLQRHELATPTITHPEELLIRVHAASLNPIDVNVLEGYGSTVLGVMRAVDAAAGGDWSHACTTQAQQQNLLVVGRDFAGVVERCGRSVRGLEAGQEVMGVVSPHKTMGSHAQFLVTHQDNVTVRPSSLSSAQCASAPYAALTAHSAAVISGCHGNVSNLRGKRVMVAGAAGGVGVMLVQILHVWGAQVVGVCSGDSFDLLSSLGVLELYDYADKDAMEAINLEHSFDLVIDASGSRDLRYLEPLKRNGSASYVSLSSPLLNNTDKHGLLMGVAKSAIELVQHNTVSLKDGRMVKWGYYTPSSGALGDIRDMMEQGQIQPVLDKVFPFSEAKAAYEHMTHGRHAGKTVLDMND